MSLTPQTTAAPVVSPFGLFYLAPDSSGNIQLWGLPLTGTAVPTPMQLGALSASASSYLCAYVGAATNILQPASTFVIIQYASSFNECDTASTVVMLSWTDSSSTVPTQVPLSGAHMGALYQMPSGQLYGLLAIDANENLNFYPAGPTGAPNFSSPVQLATGATSVQGHYITITENPLGQLINSVSFANVFFSNGPSQLFRVDTTGAHGSIFTSGGFLETSCSYRCYDATNFYFVDEVTSNSITTYNFYSTPVAGGTPTLVYSVTPPSGTSYRIVVSDGTWLILESDTATPPTTGVTALYRVATSGPSTQTATQLLQVNGTIEEYGFDYLTDDLFVNEFSSSSGTGSYTAVVLNPSGSSPQAPVAGPTANARYFELSLFSSDASSLELVNLPSSVTYGAAGGAWIEAVGASNLASGPSLTCPSCGGGLYTIPSGGAPTTSGIYGGLGVTSGITEVPGTITFASSPAVGLLMNPQTQELEVLSAPNTNVAAF